MTVYYKACSLLAASQPAENRALTLCSLARLSRMRHLDFRMIRGHPEPDQAEGDGQPLIHVHLNIWTGLGGRKGKRDTACKMKSI